jgi:hypothetical protein
MTSDHCVRCGRPVPDLDDDEYVTWEVTEDGERMICPGCMTREEYAAMYDPDLPA